MDADKERGIGPPDCSVIGHSSKCVSGQPKTILGTVVTVFSSGKKLLAEWVAGERRACQYYLADRPVFVARPSLRMKYSPPQQKCTPYFVSVSTNKDDIPTCSVIIKTSIGSSNERNGR